MVYDAVQFIADQLKAAAPNGDWASNGVDRARELAAILVRAGVRDLSQLDLAKITKRRQDHQWTEPYEVTELTLLYDGRPLGFMGTPDRQDRTDSLEGNSVAWSAAGHGHVSYVVKPGPGGGFVIVPQWGSSSDAAGIRQFLTTAASLVLTFALPLAGIAAGQAIGAAVLGPSLAAAYPAVANVVGNVAIATAMNGGNVENAVKSAVMSDLVGGAGALVGSGVTGLTNVDLLGKFADAATRAYIAGGDVGNAVAMAALQQGGAIVDLVSSSAPNTPEGASMDFDYHVATGDPEFLIDEPSVVYTDDWAGVPSSNAFDQFSTALPSDVYIPSSGPIDWSGLSLTGNASITSPIPIAPTPVQVAAAQQVNIEPPLPPQQDSFNWNSVGNIVNTVSNAALRALQLSEAFARSNASRTIVQQARSVAPNGVVTSGLDTGVVQTTQPNGVVSITRPPVGIPQATTSGNFIVNNGNGTYDVVSPTGQRRTVAYGDNTGGGIMDTLSNIPVAVWAAGAGLLLTALR